VPPVPKPIHSQPPPNRGRGEHRRDLQPWRRRRQRRKQPFEAVVQADLDEDNAAAAADDALAAVAAGPECDA
jgi:hypothetical protein